MYKNEPRQYEIAVIKYQGIAMEGIQDLLKKTDQYHEQAVNSLIKLLQIHKTLQNSLDAK